MDHPLSSKAFALTDGNSFFASCEKVFRPDLWHRPTIVLSNNDGCVVARSPEAKALKIPMGVPFFKIEGWVKKNNVAVFSSNYELYGDISHRMMQAIASLVPAIEIYSIDECFSDLTGIPDKTALGVQIRDRVFQWVRIPSCVGIASTKTLAKFANHLAKKTPEMKGVCNWFELSPKEQKDYMESQPVAEIWGIGRKLTEHLNQQKIETVFDFFRADASMIRARYGVTVERVLRELHGVECLSLEEVQPNRQQIVRSRSFGCPVVEIKELKAAVVTHAASAAEVLRRQGSAAGAMGVFIESNRFRQDLPQHSGWRVHHFEVATQSTTKLTRAATALLEQMFQGGIAYKRAGVILTDLTDPNFAGDLFAQGDTEKEKRLMAAIDKINEKYGRQTIKSGACDLGEKWHMKQERRSPRYTTRWEEVPVVG